MNILDTFRTPKLILLGGGSLLLSIGLVFSYQIICCSTRPDEVPDEVIDPDTSVENEIFERPITIPSSAHQINSAGLSLLKDFEGLALESYLDPVDVWTIGYGHTKTAAPWQKITPSEAEELLAEDLRFFETAVNEIVIVPMTSNQFSALVSFTYNVGVEQMRESTLVQKLNEGDYLSASDEFELWNHAGGRVLAGLTRRREAERVLFLSPEGVAHN